MIAKGGIITQSLHCWISCAFPTGPPYSLCSTVVTKVPQSKDGSDAVIQN
jgi:hypothetical protein